MNGRLLVHTVILAFSSFWYRTISNGLTQNLGAGRKRMMASAVVCGRAVSLTDPANSCGENQMAMVMLALGAAMCI